jgi:hypothetical protein
MRVLNNLNSSREEEGEVNWEVVVVEEYQGQQNQVW